MKKCVIAFFVVLLLFPAPFCLSQQKGASQKARERASEQSIFNRVSDWFATVGKSEEEKEKILEERQLEREKKHLEKEAKKAKKKAKAKNEEKEKMMKEKVNKMKMKKKPK